MFIYFKVWLSLLRCTKLLKKTWVVFFPVFPTLGVQNLFFPGRYLPVNTVVKTGYRPKPSNPGFQRYGFRKVWPKCCLIWQVFGPGARPYGANGQITMTLHNYRSRQFHRTSNGENPSSGYRDMGSASLAAARPDRDDNTPPARRAEG